MPAEKVLPDRRASPFTSGRKKKEIGERTGSAVYRGIVSPWPRSLRVNFWGLLPRAPSRERADAGFPDRSEPTGSGVLSYIGCLPQAAAERSAAGWHGISIEPALRP